MKLITIKSKQLTPIKNTRNIFRRLDGINDHIIQDVLNAPHADKGVFGFEIVVNSDFVETYLLLHPTMINISKGELVHHDISWINNQHTNFYLIHPINSLCFPFNNDENVNLLNELYTIPLDDEEILIQLLLSKRNDNWKSIAKRQYQDYLNGIDYPSVNRLGRSIQIKVGSALDKISQSHIEREPLQEIEDRLNDVGYRFEIRCAIRSENKNRRKLIRKQLKSILSKFDYFNALTITNQSSKLFNSMNERTFDKYSLYQVMTEREIIRLLCDNVEDKQQEANVKAETTMDTSNLTSLLPSSKGDAIYLREILENNEFKTFAKNNPLPFSFGIDDKGKILLGSLVKLKHMLVCGATGFGKSYFDNQMLLTLLLNSKPSELNMYLIDPKFVELEGFKGFPHVKDVITDINKVTPLLDSLISEMDKRYEFLREKRYKSLVNYNQDHPHSKKPFIVCLVDEYADLKMTNANIDDYIQRLGQKARAAGIHLICTTQRPDATVISGIIKANLPTKVSFALSSKTDERTVFGKGQPYHLNNPGEGVVRMEGQLQEFIKFKSPVITLDEKEEDLVLDELKKIFNGEKGIDKSAMESTKDKLKRIIARTGETRIAPLREELEIGIHAMGDLMQELVDEGWLVRHKSKSKGYELVASEEELGKWRTEGE